MDLATLTSSCSNLYDMAAILPSPTLVMVFKLSQREKDFKSSQQILGKDVMFCQCG